MNKLLKIACLNVRSLTAHFVEFKNALQLHDYDIIGITETWLTGSISDDFINIPNYNFVRADRHGRGGGVGVYLKNNISFKKLSHSGIIEQLWLQISVNNQKVGIGVVYKPPNFPYVDFLNNFENSFTMVYPKVDKIYCLGDFNINLLNFDSVEARYISEVFESVGLKQIIQEPTRITSSSATLIDYILTMEQESIIASGTKPVGEVSDHDLVYCVINVIREPKVPVFKVTRRYKNMNFVQFDANLRAIPWRNIYDIQNVNKKFSLLTKTLQPYLTFMHHSLHTA